MVDYSAYNVDPLKYQREARINLQNAVALRDRRNRVEQDNALRWDEHAARQAQNQIANSQRQQRIDNESTRIEQADALRKIQQYSALFKTASGARSQKEADNIIAAGQKAWGLEVVPQVTIKGGKIESVIELGDGRTLNFSGTKEQFSGYFDAVNANPTILSDQNKASELAARTGLSVSIGKSAQGGYKVGATREIKKGDSVVTQEYDGKNWNEIASGPRFKATGTKPEMTEKEARKGLLDIAKYREKLASTGGMGDILFTMMAKDNPELAESLKGKDKTEINKALDDHQAYLEKYAYPDGKPGAAKRYIFENGRLVPK
ncbi:hypothetical protein DSCA_60100 [Desulfosarcina alkanivorans]|uniref:Uncharacterized protein n=1 Tax=Desulfosarcina alkanivorans TaxID=571177 RepID=A0A5K7YUU1_9BACT|nr:hypothetical protein [Desulfosarcina alkanivorans]BBO72080.1 hypothetical protein DSCA_60100 [Desulfosarcina alkanivorans]